MNEKNENIVWHQHSVTRKEREAIKNQKGCLLFFTGLSGSGKSTIANALEVFLNKKKYHTYLLDGDNIRHGLNNDLGFDKNSRKENIRRVVEVSKLFVDAGIITIAAFIAPFREDREMARKAIGNDRFVEIFVDTPIEECIKRDPKGLYAKAIKGEIQVFTGIDGEYEKPANPDICIDAFKVDVFEIVRIIYSFLKYTKHTPF